MQTSSLKRGIEEALGFKASFSSEQSGWRNLDLYGWQGHLDECKIQVSDRAMVILHLAGAVTSVAIGGRVLNRPSAPGLLTLVPVNSNISCRVNGDIHAISLHLDPEDFGWTSGTSEGPDALQPRGGFHDEFLAAAIRELADEAANPRDTSELYADTLAMAIALHIGRSHVVAKTDTVNRMSHQVMRLVKDLIENSIECGISLSDLSASAGMSRARFFRTFKAAEGISPHKYLMRRRLSRSQVLLANSNRTIASVALKCGFANQAHFTTFFGRMVGMTPLGYRRAVSTRGQGEADEADANRGGG